MTASPGDPSEDRRPLPPFGPAFSRPAPGAPAAGASAGGAPLPPFAPFSRPQQPVAPAPAEPVAPSASQVVEEYAPAAAEQDPPVEERMPWEEEAPAPVEAPSAGGADEDGDEPLPWLIVDEVETSPAAAVGEEGQPGAAADTEDFPEWLSWADEPEETAPVSAVEELAAPAAVEPEASPAPPAEEAEGPSFEVTEPWAEPGVGAEAAASGEEAQPLGAADAREETASAPTVEELAPPAAVEAVEAEEPRYEVMESWAEPAGTADFAAPDAPAHGVIGATGLQAAEATPDVEGQFAGSEADVQVPASVSAEPVTTDEPAQEVVGAIGLEAAEATPDVEGLFAASQAAAVEDAYTAPSVENGEHAPIGEEPVAEAPAALSNAGEVPADAFAEVAARLERIARSLREDPSGVLAGGEGRDPLELLITGFVLGYAQGRGRGA